MSVYNCEKTVIEALESLFSQTYQDFKIVLCEDGSSDNTAAILDSYVSVRQNIKLIKNRQNIKLAASLNRCLEYVDTEYVARMDGDDISLPTRLEKQIKFLDDNPRYAIVSCPMTYFDENGDWGRGRVITEPTFETFKTRAPHAHGPSVMRTEALLSVGGYTVSKRLQRGQDFYLWYQFYGNLPHF